MLTISEIMVFISTMNETICKFMVLIVVNDVFYNEICVCVKKKHPPTSSTRWTHKCIACAIIFAFDHDFQCGNIISLDILIGVGFHRILFFYFCHILSSFFSHSLYFCFRWKMEIVCKIKFSKLFKKKKSMQKNVVCISNEPS